MKLLKIIAISNLVIPSAIATPFYDIDNMMELDISELMNIETTIASRSIESVETAPSSVTIFTKKELSNMGITKFNDIFNFVPGTQESITVSSAPQNVPIFRGIKAGGNEVLIMVNGHVIDDVNNDNPALILNNFSLDNIERVEIIRGPGSTLYGSNAFSSVINLITVKGVNNVTVEGGTFDSKKLSVNFSHDFSDDLQFNLYLNKESDNGDYYSNIFDPNGISDSTQDPKFAHNAYMEMGYKDLNISLQYNDSEMRDFYVANDILNGTNMQKNEYTQVDINYTFPKIINELETRVNLHASNKDYRARAIFGKQGTGPFTDANFIAGAVAETNTLSGSFDFDYEINNNHQLKFGIEYETDDMPDAGHNSNYDAAQNFTVYLGGIVDQLSDDVRFIADRRRKSQSLYFQDYYKWSDKISTTFGVRYDHFNTVGETINPRLALIYNKNKNHTFKFMYGSAFKAPSRFKNGAINNPLISGNPNLDSMDIKTFELAHIYSNGYLQFISTIYHNNIKNLIGISSGTYENSASYKNSGIELEALYMATKNLNIRATFSQVIQGKTKTGGTTVDKSEQYAAHQLGSISVNYNKDKWNYNLNGFFRNDVDILPSQGIFGVLNANIQHQVGKDSIFYLNIRNMLDTKYYDAADGPNGLGLQNGVAVRQIPNRGRQFLLGLKYNY